MSVTRRPPLPVILVANDLLDGNVVFAAAQGWSRDHRDALVAHSDAAADALEAAGRAAFLAQRVVDPYLVDVTEAPDGVPMPRHYRERLRTLGPSNRLDLGKQAEAQRS